MWKSKKFIMILTLAILALVGGTTGAVLAASDSGTDSTADTQAETQSQALLDRICAIYQENTGVALDPDQLQSAFQQAQQEMRQQALENRLQALVDNGTITQDEADQLLAWWQAKPDVDLPGIKEFGLEGGMMGGRGHHGWGGGPYCGDISGDTSDTTTT